MDITSAQFDAVGRRRMIERVSQALVDQYPPALDLGPARVERVAADAIQVARGKGFVELGSVLWFALTMLKVHPRFHDRGSIRQALEVGPDARSERDRIAAAVDDGADQDWESAGRRGGYEAYYAEIFGRD